MGLPVRGFKEVLPKLQEEGIRSACRGLRRGRSSLGDQAGAGGGSELVTSSRDPQARVPTGSLPWASLPGDVRS